MGSKSSKEVVNESRDLVNDSKALIEDIESLFTQLRARADSDLKTVNNPLVVFKHEHFMFHYDSTDDIAGLMDVLGGAINKLKPDIKNAKSEAPEALDSSTIQGVLNTNFSKGLDALLGLFALALPQIGNRAGINYTWSIDMRLLDNNLFLYNACFCYSFKQTGYFKQKNMSAYGFFSRIFQSNEFLENFVKLKQQLFQLDNFDENAEALRKLQVKLNSLEEQVLDIEDEDKLARTEKSIDRLTQTVKRRREDLGLSN